MFIRSEKSKVYWLNNISNFIVNHFESTKNQCKIQLAYTENFLVVKGFTSSQDTNITHKLHDYIEENDIVKKIGNGCKNIISLLSTKEFKPSLDVSYRYTNGIRPLFLENQTDNNIIECSDLLFGLSLDFKIPYYFGEMISKDIMKFTKSDNVYLQIKDNELTLDCRSIYKMKDLESCVMDVYNFNFDDFKYEIRDFDFNKEIVEPLSDRPWLNKSKINEFVII